MLKKIFLVAAILFLMFQISCKGKSETKTEAKTETKTTESVITGGKENTMGLAEPKQSTVDPAKKYEAVIKTSKGDIVCELFAADAPISVTNFKQLADAGYYKGLTFHRVVPDFVIQGGDPTGTGAGGPGYTIPAEIKKPHKTGALAWARTGDEVNPQKRSSGSQFYITYKDTPFLDGGYTVFGQTIQGMDVVNKIQQGDTIIDVTVAEN